MIGLALLFFILGAMSALAWASPRLDRARRVRAPDAGERSAEWHAKASELRRVVNTMSPETRERWLHMNTGGDA